MKMIWYGSVSLDAQWSAFQPSLSSEMRDLQRPSWGRTASSRVEVSVSLGASDQKNGIMNTSSVNELPPG